MSGSFQHMQTVRWGLLQGPGRILAENCEKIAPNLQICQDLVFLFSTLPKPFSTGTCLCPITVTAEVMPGRTTLAPWMLGGGQSCPPATAKMPLKSETREKAPGCPLRCLPQATRPACSHSPGARAGCAPLSLIEENVLELWGSPEAARHL